MPITLTLDQLPARVDELHQGRGKGRVLIGIAGPPGAGKSTTTQWLAERIHASVALPMDGFHLAQVQLTRLGRADRKGAPDTFDAAGFAALLARVRTGETDASDDDRGRGSPGGRAEGSPDRGAPDGADNGSRPEPVHTVYAPAFNRELEEPIAGSIAITPEHRVILVEGNYLLHDADGWVDVRGLLDEVWFLDLPDDVRVDRLISRHIGFGRSPEAARTWVQGVDEPNAVLINLGRERADVVVGL